MTNYKLMLYQPKGRPLSLLNDVSEYFSKSPIIERAYYCVGSILENSKISEKDVVGVQILNNVSKEELLLVDEICEELASKYKELIFVQTDKPPFKKYFLLERPFYHSTP